MKTNSGKIYEVVYTDPKEKKSQTYVEQVYATCEEHARLIFEAAIPNMEIESIEFNEDCISQHYGSGEDTKIPEFELATNIMYAILGEMSRDKSVTETDAQAVLDIAYHMASLALKKAIEGTWK